MRKNVNASGLRVVLFFVAVCALLLIVNFNTPLASSDYFYRFFFNEWGQADNNHPIAGFGDLFQSQWNHFLHTNGRLPVHVLVQSFVAFSGKWLFNILNPLFFCCYVWLIVKVALRKVSLVSVAFVTMLLLLFMPLFHAYYCWFAGSVNYLWSSVLILLFLCALRAKEGEPMGWRSVPFLVLSFFAGWTHEGISLPIAMALVARTLLFRRSPRRLPFCMELAFLLGAAMCAVSSLHRSHAAEASDADGLLYNSFLILWSVFTQLRFFFAAVVLLILALLRRKTGLVTFLAENFVWVVSVLITFAIILYAQMEDNQRALYLIELASLMLTLRLLALFDVRAWVRQTGLTVSVLVSIAVCLGACYWSVKNYREFQSQERQILEGHPVVLVDSGFSIPAFWERYICQTIGPRDVPAMCYPGLMACRVRAAYYGVESVCYLQRELPEMMRCRPEAFNEFTDGGFMHCYVMRLEEGERVDAVLLHVRRAARGEVAFPDCLVSAWLPLYADTLLNSNFQYINHEGADYVCVPKIPEIDGRIQSIELQTSKQE